VAVLCFSGRQGSACVPYQFNIRIWLGPDLNQIYRLWMHPAYLCLWLQLYISTFETFEQWTCFFVIIKR